MKLNAFITHKLKENFSDCQDRFGVNPDTKSVAVSDGMGSTWQQKIWAQLLVDTFTNRSDWFPTHENIKPLCSVWRDKVVDFIQNLKDTDAPNNLIFRNERNLNNGRSAGATFVGIRFDEMKWMGSVLGDSCLIEWNGSEAKFYTSQDGETFDSFPDYFDSSKENEGKGTPKLIEGTISEGIILIMVSDPFSEFLLEHNKQGDISNYIQQLLNISSHGDYEKVVENWRKAGMHNDDTTLVIIEYDESNDINLQSLDDINDFIEKERSEAEKVIEEGNVKNEIIPIQTINQSIPTGDIQELKSIETDICPISEEEFIEEILQEYRSILEKKKLLGKLKFKVSQKAVKEALHRLYDRYLILKK